MSTIGVHVSKFGKRLGLEDEERGRRATLANNQGLRDECNEFVLCTIR